MNSLKLYSRYVGVSFRSQMQYKASFIMFSIGSLLASGMELVALWVLFDRFKTLKGWSLPEAAMLYGMVNISFAIAEASARGFDMFHHMVKSGDFDRLLLRPRSTALQVLGQEFKWANLGRFAQGFAALIWAAGTLGAVWTPLKALLLIGAIGGGACLFGGILVLQATMCFWTIESLEIMNIMTYGGIETAQYPLSIYHPWLRRFFTFIIPLACINYFPSLAILDRPAPSGLPYMFLWVAPVVGVLFLMVALRVWKFGVRHYCSTGS